MATSTITDVSVSFPAAEEILNVLTLSAGFNAAIVVIGTTFLGIAAGVTGTFALLRKRSMMGDALAHASLPGIATAFILASYLGWDAKSLPLLLTGAACSGVLGVLTVQLISKATRLAEDAAIGIVLSVFFGAGIALLSVIQDLGTGNEGGLSTFIYGQTAAMGRNDALLMSALAVLAIICTSLLAKEFRLICFDSDFASTQGWPTNFLDLSMMTLIVLVTIVGLQSVGIILIIALLIIPATAARFWSENLAKIVLLAGLFGGLSGYLGSSASALLPRLPAGSVIVLTAGALFALSLAFAPERGVLAAWFRRAKLREAVVKEHILREAFELQEARGMENRSFKADEIPLLARMVAHRKIQELRKLLKESLITEEPKGSYLLSAKGLTLATQITRKHRLWETYLITFGHLPSSHVDNSADLAEHVLSDATISTIENELIAAGALSEPGALPQSSHPVGSEA